MVMGAWGFAFFQITILTYVVVSALRFFNKSFLVGIIAILMSATGFNVITVMMDVYTGIGLLALFLILNGSKDIVLYIILALCYGAHYGNVALFSVCALVYGAICNRKYVRAITGLSIVFISFFLVANLRSCEVEKNFYFLSLSKCRFFQFMSRRIMTDSPEITKAYITKYPESDLSKKKETYEYLISKRPLHKWELHHHIGRKLVDFLSARTQYEFVIYALKNHPGILLKNSIYNTYKFLEMPHFEQGLVRKRHCLIDRVNTYLPHQVEQAKRSLQYNNKLSDVISEPFYAACYYINLFITFSFLIGSLWFRDLRRTKHFSFAVFVIILLFCNAAIISNIVGACGRYQVRVMLLPSLAAVLIMSEYFKLVFKKFKPAGNS